MKHDDASWHYENDYPKNLPTENAATHIGIFLQWCIENDMLSDELNESSKDDIIKVKEHKMTGAEFLIENCDERLLDDDLNELGNNFAKDYYGNDTKFTKKHDSYYNDYEMVFSKYETLYHVENTFENYSLIKPVIDIRFMEWKQYRKMK